MVDIVTIKIRVPNTGLTVGVVATVAIGLGITLILVGNSFANAPN
jgi:hypothetical protein